MNGPQHYREAETALAIVRENATELDADDRAALIAMGQVHAALADVAFRVDLHLRGGVEQWRDVTQ